MPNDRIAYYDNAKFILVMLVVAGHFIELLIGESALAFAIRFCIYTFHMPCFIFISGLFFNKKKVKENTIFFFSVFVFMVWCSLLKSFVFYHNTDIDIFSISSPPWFMLALCAWNLLAYTLYNVNYKYIVALFIALSLIAGYDAKIGDYLALSRIIYFFPFFIAGRMFDPNNVQKISEKTKYKIAAIIYFLLLFYVSYKSNNFSHLLSPMLSGRNPYNSLIAYNSYGFVVRLLCYLLQIYSMIAFLCIVPTDKTPFSKLGSRTIAVYSIHPLFMSMLTKYLDKKLYVYVIAAVIITIVLSNNMFMIPFRKIKVIIRGDL